MKRDKRDKKSRFKDKELVNTEYDEIKDEANRWGITIEEYLEVIKDEMKER